MLREQEINPWYRTENKVMTVYCKKPDKELDNGEYKNAGHVEYNILNNREREIS